MVSRVSVSASRSAELYAVAERLLASGRYGNFSEVVRAALRLLDERETGFQTHLSSQTARGADVNGSFDT